MSILNRFLQNVLNPVVITKLKYKVINEIVTLENIHQLQKKVRNTETKET